MLLKQFYKHRSCEGRVKRYLVAVPVVVAGFEHGRGPRVAAAAAAVALVIAAAAAATRRRAGGGSTGFLLRLQVTTHFTRLHAPTQNTTSYVISSLSCTFSNKEQA